MTVSIAVTLTCDSRRVPGCEWSYDLGAAMESNATRRLCRKCCRFNPGHVKCRGCGAPEPYNRKYVEPPEAEGAK